MLRALALLFLAPLLGAVTSEAWGDDLVQIAGEEQAANLALFARANAHLGEDLTTLTGYEPHSLVLAVPVFASGESYSLCLLYDYARTDKIDPISTSGLAEFDGSKDARNLGLGLWGLMTEKLEFEAVVGHSHLSNASNSAYAGIIYNVNARFGLGTDIGHIHAAGQDSDRLRAFARFYF